MISIAYVKGTDNVPHINDLYMAFEKEMDSINSEIDEIFGDLYVLYKECELDVFMNEATEEDTEQKKESAAKSVIDKVGQRVISMFEKAIAFITSIFNKFKEASFKNKSNVEKLEILTKKHPDLKDQVIASYEAGDLKIADVKSLTELDKAFDEVMALDDPNTMKAKWAKAKQKVVDNADFLKAIGIAVGTVTTVITVGAVIKKYRGDAAAAASKIDERKTTIRQKKEELAHMLNDTGKLTSNTDALRARTMIANEYIKTNTDWCNKTESFFANIQMKINNLCEKWDNKFMSQNSKDNLKSNISDMVTRGASAAADVKIDKDKKKADLELVTNNIAKAKEDLRRLTRMSDIEIDTERANKARELSKKIDKLNEEIKQLREKKDVEELSNIIKGKNTEIESLRKQVQDLLSAIGKGGKKK